MIECVERSRIWSKVIFAKKRVILRSRVLRVAYDLEYRYGLGDIVFDILLAIRTAGILPDLS